ncbi:FAD:protein FMN transferase [Candidatus Omnitrophota bacterium]
MRKFTIFIISSVLILTILASLAIKTQEKTELMMGTFVKITIRGPFWFDFKRAQDSAFSAMRSVDIQANMYNEESELSKVNARAFSQPVDISDDLYLLIKDSIDLHRRTGGLFDITVAPLVKLWNRYKEERLPVVKSEVISALSLVGSEKIVLYKDEKRVRFIKEGLSLDLSAVAKGYAVDKGAEALKKRGVKSAIVNAGGDIYCIGRRNFFQPWRIGVISPKEDNKILKVLNLSDKAVATSGGYEQRFNLDGKNYSHLINPKTGYPVESVFTSVSVVAPTCILADGIATAVSVGGRELAEKLRLIYDDIYITIEE